jgi:NodT family efflux transporter outer membrane factor (OMF) lipoprotein
VQVGRIDDRVEHGRLSTLTEPIGHRTWLAVLALENSCVTLCEQARGQVPPLRRPPVAARVRLPGPLRAITAQRPAQARAALVLPGALLALLCGCSVGPDFKRPSVWSPVSWFASRPIVPASYEASLPVAQPIDPAWWKLLGDDKLTALEGRVGAQNLNVRLTTVRLAESRAQLRLSSVNLFPQINGRAQYQRDQISQKEVQRGLSTIGGRLPANLAGTASGFGSTQVPPIDLWSDGIDSSYEIDLWGRVRRTVEAGEAALEASGDARRNALLSALAEVARDYVQLRGNQELLRIARENLVTEQQSLGLTRQRSSGGLGTDLDVAQAAAQVESTRSQIPQLEQQVQQTINALSLLLGEGPGALRAELEAPGPVPPVPPRVPIGLPSELVRRRPDIRQAEAQLHSATAQVGVAVASFYPSVTLSANLTFTALQFRDLGFWSNKGYTLGPNITIPIFQGGQLRGQLALNNAQQQEAATNYQQTVFQAWHDVDNALIAYGAEQSRRDALQRSVEQNQRALVLARDRYTQGLSDFLNVLTQERSVLAAQQQLADSTVTVTQNLVQLYKALGGGWEESFPAAPEKAAAATGAAGPG